jgi:hypothetical protein
MTKEQIINNVENLSSDQLCEAIKLGYVTLEELQNTENLDASKRKAIRACLEQVLKADENAWKDAQIQQTVYSFSDYLEKFPNGKFIINARDELYNLKKKHSEEERERNRMLDSIKTNPNAYPPGIIRKYLNDGSLSGSSLKDIGIPDKIIDKLYKNDMPPTWQLGQMAESIPEGYTEVYFWGIRGSGKTTALAALLSTANKMGYLEIARGPGYNYMLQLQNLFNDSITILPAATQIDITQYLPFTLKESNEKYSRSVSLIELSGEIFQCFLYKNANRPLPLQHEETFNSLLRFLENGNRKLHFFFIDYERSNSVDQDGYTQANYLNAAATFFNDPKYDFFRKTTDAIYIVITKSDLMPSNNESKAHQLIQYLSEENFTAFVNSLKAKCKLHSINDGKLLGTPIFIRQSLFY